MSVRRRRAGPRLGGLDARAAERDRQILVVEEGAGLGPAFATAYGFSMQDAWRRFLAGAKAPVGASP